MTETHPQPRKIRVTTEIATPTKGRKGLGQPVRVTVGGGLSRAHLSGDLFNEKGSGRLGLVTQPQKEGLPLPWLLFSAVWGNPDDHDAYYDALGEGGTPQWLAAPGAYVARGTLHFSVRAESMKQIELALHAGPMTDDTGVFRLLLPRRLPSWLHLYSDGAQLFLPL